MNHFSQLALAVTLLATSALVPGCEATETKACTMMGCQSGFGVAFQTASWPTGTWKVIAQTPTGERVCTVALPLPSDGQPQCTGQLQLGTSGSALAPAQHALSGVQLPDTPTSVTLEVLRDGKSVAKKTFAPVYKTTQPNGAGCEPTCTQANEVLTW